MLKCWSLNNLSAIRLILVSRLKNFLIKIILVGVTSDVVRHRRILEILCFIPMARNWSSIVSHISTRHSMLSCSCSPLSLLLARDWYMSVASSSSVSSTLLGIVTLGGCYCTN